jgi:hypothetical protein
MKTKDVKQASRMKILNPRSKIGREGKTKPPNSAFTGEGNQ